jgi:hypothetical protein
MTNGEGVLSTLIWALFLNTAVVYSAYSINKDSRPRKPQVRFPNSESASGGLVANLCRDWIRPKFLKSVCLSTRRKLSHGHRLKTAIGGFNAVPESVPLFSLGRLAPIHRKENLRDRKKTPHSRRNHNWHSHASQNSAKLCVFTWNACVLSGEMWVCCVTLCSHWSEASITILPKTTWNVLDAADQWAATTHARFLWQRTRIPCKHTQFWRMRVCVNCDRSSPVKIGEVFFLPLLPYSMAPIIDYRCDNRCFWLSAHNCQVPTPTSQNLDLEQQIRIFEAG